MSHGGGMSRAGRTVQAKMPYAVSAADSEHPAPPSELTEEEAEIWRGFVDKMPPDYFAPPTWPMLLNLCHHVYGSRMFTQQIRAHEAELREVQKLANHRLDGKHDASGRRASRREHELLRTIMQLRRGLSAESRTIGFLCNRLKLTQLYDTSNMHKARRCFLNEQRPWDIPEDDLDELPQ